jgi:proteasome accessory factor B
VQKVILQFSWQQGNYIKSFPLNTSQKIISDTEDELLIELFIHPTNDIVMELMKYGSDVKILEPKSLQNEIKRRIVQMTKLYQ